MAVRKIVSRACLESNATRHCSTDDQERTVSKLERLAQNLGVPLRFGTTVGKYPQTIILDYNYQDGAVRVSSNGSFEINGEEFGHYSDPYFDFSDVDVDDVKSALLSLKGEDYEESLTESEESSSEFYGVFEKGGSIGKSYATRDDLRVWSGRGVGTLVKVFSSSDEAKNYAKRMRSRLSPGERSYYGMGYFVKKLSKKDLEHPQVIDMISNMPGSSASQVDEESLNESDNVWSTPESAAKYLFDKGILASDYVERACKRHGKDNNFAHEVEVIIDQMVEEECEDEFGVDQDDVQLDESKDVYLDSQTRYELEQVLEYLEYSAGAFKKILSRNSWNETATDSLVDDMKDCFNRVKKIAYALDHERYSMFDGR